ncbi:MAG TPA: AraC family transcriptional regulator [Flavobacteriia bacterium]|nr:AraC family transcriptional regulator [Flavobacteriia bacterium]
MLKTIQIIALIQGILLVFILLYYKKQQRKPAFWLLIGSIISILLYIMGDDANNLFFNEMDWFFLDETLFITLFFLFVKYFISKKDDFNTRDYLYFIPNILYLFNEVISEGEMPLAFRIFELSVELIFLGYLLYTLLRVIKVKRRQPKWLVFFLIPLTIVLGTFFMEELLLFLRINFSFEGFMPENSYVLVIAAFLFYFITVKLIFSQKEFSSHLLKSNTSGRYHTSGLQPQKIEGYKKQLLQLVEQQQLYKDPKLSIDKVALALGIPRQYVSEIVNVHLHTNFQEFINQYRVNAFIENLPKKQYQHFTLFGIANEVGFNSKSSFNAIFKKIKGLTPSEYKKKLLTHHKMSLK